MAAHRAVRATAEQGGAEVVRDSRLGVRLRQIRDDAQIPQDTPREVVAEAERVIGNPLQLPEHDATDVPFVTIDPPGSMDLDQALHLERSGEGYRVRYAIAHLPSFVAPGGAIDEDAWTRGQTIYAPDIRIPLHPTVMSEGPASLLPDQVSPAYVWDLRLDAEGELVETALVPSMVRSRRRYDYAEVQAAVEDGSAEEVLLLLREVGEKRLALEAARGGATLPMPEQEVVVVPGDASAPTAGGETYEIRLRPLLPAEDWNAQISLLTGMAAAQLMLAARVGILRTMPEPDADAVARLRQVARGLQIDWPEAASHGEVLRSLDRTDPRHLALIHEATSLFRGAGYTAFDGELPDVTEQAAIAAPYAHVTAPLRRLVDRYGLALCAALAAGEKVPDWVREALPRLPEAMTASDRRAGQVERDSTEAVATAALADEVGSVHPAVVVDAPDKPHQDEGGQPGHLEVQLLDRPILTRARGRARLGDQVSVRVEAADVAAGRLDLTVVEEGEGG